MNADGPDPDPDATLPPAAQADPYATRPSDLAVALPPTEPAPATAYEGVSVPGYAVHGVLGRGGMGVVYDARQVKADRRVALKMVLAGGHASADELARFRTEAEAVARLQHPNIVQVFEVGESDGRPFFSLEFCPGGSLAGLLDGTPVTPARAAELVEPLARGVQAAHDAGVVHRDLKPANVLLAAGGTPKITDFGLAKKLDADSGQTRTGAIMGTPSYMAPEQAGGHAKNVGPPADVYSLGAILYECLTGRPPFKSGTPLDTLMQVVSGEPVPPSRLNAKVPRDLETVVLKCLQKVPAKRYASASALADDLRRFREGRPIAARPVGRLERGWRWCRRNPVVAGLIAAVAGSLMAGAGIATWQAVRASDRADAAARARHDAERQLDRAEWLLYAGQLSRAAREMEAGHDATALDDLDLCRWDRRGWEHRYLFGLAQQHPAIPAPSPTQGVWDFSADGRLFAAAQPDGAVEVFDTLTGVRVGPRLPVTGPVSHVRFSPDGRYLAVGSHGTDFEKLILHPVRMVVWDPRAGGPALALASTPRNRAFSMSVNTKDRQGKDVTLKGILESLHAVEFSPDGRLVAFAVDAAQEGGGVEIWDVAARRAVKQVPRGDLLRDRLLRVQTLGLALSPDGGRVAQGAAGVIQVMGVGNAEKVSLAFAAGGILVRAVAFSPDGRRVAAAGQNGTVKVWDAADGTELLSLIRRAIDRETPVLAFAPDGRRLAAGGNDGSVTVWDARTGRELFAERLHTGPVRRVGFTPDARSVVSTGTGWDGRPAYKVRPLTGRLGPGTLHTGGPVATLAVSPDGKRVYAALTKGTVQAWNISDAAVPVVMDPGQAELLAVSSDGRYLAVAGNASVQSGNIPPQPGPTAVVKRYNQVRLRDAHSGELVFTATYPSSISAIRFDQESRRLAVACNPSGQTTGDLQVLELPTGRQVFVRETISAILGMAFRPDGTALAAGRAHNSVIVWDAANGRELQTFAGHAGPVHAVDYASDARLASAGADRTVRVWPAAGPDQPLVLTGHAEPVRTIAFDPDGGRLVSASADSVRVWEAGSGAALLELKGDGTPMTCAAFGDGTRVVATATAEGGVRVWSAETEPDSYRLRGGVGPFTAVAFDPEGKQLSARNREGRVFAWDLATGRPVEGATGPDSAAGVSALSPDGRWRAIETGDTILLIDTARAELNRRFARDRLAALDAPDPAWHRAEADAAEKIGDAFAAAFHLDRLAPLRPWDAAVHARRATALARLGRGDQAAVAFLQATLADPAFDFRTVKLAAPVAPPGVHPVETIPPPRTP